MTNHHPLTAPRAERPTNPKQGQLTWPAHIAAQT